MTETTSFGTTPRESHDASSYYGRRLFGSVPMQTSSCVITQAPPEVVEHFYCQSSESMHQIPDGSVGLVVTSPPYCVGKEYDDDLTLHEYLELLRNVFTECYRILEPGGRTCINIANIGRKPYIPLTAHVNQIMERIGFAMRGEIIWVKGKTPNQSCAWGSWRSASNPSLRDAHEYILVHCKPREHKDLAQRFARGRKGESRITSEEFMAWTGSVWEIQPESAKRVGHPAPFPLELPRRCIKLFSYVDDLVVDPFCGAGTTCAAALQLGRPWIGYDIEQSYIDLAMRRMGL